MLLLVLVESLNVKGRGAARSVLLKSCRVLDEFLDSSDYPFVVWKSQVPVTV